MRKCRSLGDIACVMDVLPGAAGALRWWQHQIVKLQRDADDVVALGFQQCAVAEERRRRTGGRRSCVLWRPVEIRLLAWFRSSVRSRGFGASQLERRFRIVKKACSQMPCSAPGPTSACRNAVKLLFNIGRIPAKPIAEPVCTLRTQILPPGRKGGCYAWLRSFPINN